jgi:hypothetical protein
MTFTRRDSMKAFRVSMVLALLLMGSACSWFRHKDKTAEPAQPAADAAANEAAPASPPESAASTAEAASPAAPAEAAQGPAAVAIDFLSMHQRFGNSGLPDRGSMNAYAAFLCPNLSEAIRAAQVRQEQFKASHPDEKPPLVDGDLFSSLFEGPETFAVSDTRINAGKADVDVAMSHGEGNGTTRWTDTLQFDLDDGIWCLSDVQYHGTWPFANKGSLGTTLQP